jgi:hypothetical protein
VGLLAFMNASISASGLILAAFSRLDSSVSISNSIKGKKQNLMSISREHIYTNEYNIHVYIFSQNYVVPKRSPTPWQRAANASVSLTVISPMWRSCWLMYADVLSGTNSVISCQLYVTLPVTCGASSH